MNLIIAGGRNFNDNVLMESEFLNVSKGVPLDSVTIISGAARGADTLAIQLANKYRVNLICMSPDWKTHGKSAGYKRNVAMANKATHLLAVWDGKSKGTRHMIETAVAKGLIVKVVGYEALAYRVLDLAKSLFNQFISSWDGPEQSSEEYWSLYRTSHGGLTPLEVAQEQLEEDAYLINEFYQAHVTNEAPNWGIN